MAPNDGLLACAGYQRVRLFDPTTGKERFTEGRLSGPVWEVFFATYKGKGAAVIWERAWFGSDPSDRVRFWDTATGKRVGQWPGSIPLPLKIAVRPNGNLFAVLGGKEGNSLWNIAAGKSALPLKEKLNMPWTPFPRWRSPRMALRFAVLLQPLPTNLPDALSRVCLWETDNWKEVGTLEGHFDFVQALAFAPDSNTLVFTGQKEKLLFWNLATGRQHTVKIKGGIGLRRVAWSPDGRLLAVGPIFDKPLHYRAVSVYR